MNLESVIGLIILTGTFILTPRIKEGVALRLVKKKEFDNVDVEWFVRGVIFFSLLKYSNGYSVNHP